MVGAPGPPPQVIMTGAPPPHGLHIIQGTTGGPGGIQHAQGAFPKAEHGAGGKGGGTSDTIAPSIEPPHAGGTKTTPPGGTQIVTAGQGLHIGSYSNRVKQIPHGWVLIKVTPAGGLHWALLVKLNAARAKHTASNCFIVAIFLILPTLFIPVAGNKLFGFRFYTSK